MAFRPKGSPNDAISDWRKLAPEPATGLLNTSPSLVVIADITARRPVLGNFR